MLKRRRYMLTAAIVLLLVLFGVLLYDSLSGMRTGPSANGTYFVMREAERNERNDGIVL